MIIFCSRLLVVLCILGLFSQDLKVFAQTKEEAKPYLAKQPKITIRTTDLLGRLALRPELLNADYLEYYLGPITQSIKQPSALSQYTKAVAAKTIWQPQTEVNILDKLETSQQSQSNYIAEFMTNIPQTAHLEVQDIDTALRVDSKKSFDENGQPIDIYTTRPDTHVLIYPMPGLRDISKIRIKYAGYNPGLPTQADMQEASDYRRSLAFAHYDLGNYRQAISLLNEHLKANPNDTEAHLKLAEAYKANSSLNESINEYRIALAQSGDDTDLRSRCLAGLHSLKIDPPKIDSPMININQTPGQTTTLSPPTSIKSSQPSTSGPFDVGF